MQTMGFDSECKTLNQMSCYDQLQVWFKGVRCFSRESGVFALARSLKTGSIE
jgi:hypothetical protein